MAEFDTITITNPTKEDFTARWNGEPYTLKAGESRSYPLFVAMHMAKHLTTKMLEPEADKLREEFKETGTVPQVATLVNNDNPSRRIALFDVFGDKALVEEFFLRVPFKAFIGDMSVYDKYVEKKTSKSAPTPPETPEQASPAQTKKAQKSE